MSIQGSGIYSKKWAERFRYALVGKVTITDPTIRLLEIVIAKFAGSFCIFCGA